MKRAKIMTALTLAVAASSVTSVALAALVCEQTAGVQVPLVCTDDQFDTGYQAVGVADSTTVTVSLNAGDGTPVRADTAGYAADGDQVARAVTVEPGGSESDTKPPAEDP